MPRKTKYNIELRRGHGSIDFILKDFQTMAYTEDEEGLWEIISSQKWTIQLKEDGMPRYLYSNTCKKTLYQVVIDYYFGEDVRKKATKNNMVIEHLNNNGLDCCISNLYFLHKIKNTYKGNYFDKYTKESLPIFALRVFHIIKNGTFQITIGFTADAHMYNYKSKPISSIKFLYKGIEYWNVIQDAETMIDELLEKGRLSFNNSLYRYKDCRVEFGEYFTYTEEEAKEGILPGNVIWRNGEQYIVMGDPNRIRINSVPFEENWDI